MRIGLPLVISEDGPLYLSLLTLWISFSCTMPALVFLPCLKKSVDWPLGLSLGRDHLPKWGKTSASDGGTGGTAPRGAEQQPLLTASVTHLIKGSTYFQMLRAGAGAIHKTRIERSAFAKFALMFSPGIDPRGEL